MNFKLDIDAETTVAWNTECPDLQTRLLMLLQIEASQALRPIFIEGEKFKKPVPNIETNPEPVVSS